MRLREVLVWGVVVSVAAGCGSQGDDGARAVSTPAASTDRQYLLERVDDAAVVQLYADGFERLDLRQKVLIWHLYQAALAGRDIYYDQRYTYNLEMREIFEEVLTHADGVDPGTLSRDRALREAVLDQHRPVQQPDRAKVRAGRDACRVRGGGQDCSGRGRAVSLTGW